MRQVFLTGGSGFVGSAVIRRLRAEGLVIRALSRTPETDAVLTALGAEPVRGELGTLQPEMLQGCEAIIHAAAHVAPWGPWETFQRITVEGTQQLLQAAREAGVPRFIHISTEAVLFNGGDLVDVDETAPYPDTPFPYPRSKQLAEQAVRAAHTPGVFETLALRPRLIWGPGDRTILRAAAEMVAKGRFRWIGGGNNRTSHTHVDNLAHAVWLSLHTGRGGEAYFVTDGPAHTMREFMTRYLATQGIHLNAGNLNRSLALLAARCIEGLWALFRPGIQPPITRFSIAILSATCTLRDEKARRELGYAPVVDFEEGMKAMPGPR